MAQKKSYHPPDPGKYEAPDHEAYPSYIKGEKAVAGFGVRGFYVAAVSSKKARDIILKHHYSHRIVNNSYVHLGVFFKSNLAGALQFGYALNPALAGKVVEGTKQGEYLELNRMWLSDVCPRNSESRAISYAVKYIKVAMPTVAWIQSFADERCGGLGVVYQASNFLFCGSHITKFYFLDCEYYHPMLLTAHKKAGDRGRLLRANLGRAISLQYRQFRYVFFIKKAWTRRLRLPTRPYPKPEHWIPTARGTAN